MSIRKDERDPVTSVIFQLQECIDAVDALAELNAIHQAMLSRNFDDSRLPFRRQTTITLLEAVRDCFCIRLRSLLDMRSDVHSLKKYFNGPAIVELEKNPVTVASIKARHGNIAHMGKKYVEWPEVDDILNSGLKNLLEGIRIGIIFDRSR